MPSKNFAVCGGAPGFCWAVSWIVPSLVSIVEPSGIGFVGSSATNLPPGVLTSTFPAMAVPATDLPATGVAAGGGGGGGGGRRGGGRRDGDGQLEAGDRRGGRALLVGAGVARAAHVASREALVVG